MQDQGIDSRDSMADARNARRRLSLEMAGQSRGHGEGPSHASTPRFLGRGKMRHLSADGSCLSWSTVGRGMTHSDWSDINNNSTLGACRTPSPAPCKGMEPMWSPTNLRSSECASPTSPTSDTCSDCSFCSRPAASIICRACGHTFHGRVRARCPNHSSVIHLMDFEACPNCKAYQLKEFMKIRSPTVVTSPQVSPTATTYSPPAPPTF